MREKAKFATPQQTKRWIRCVLAWAKSNGKKQEDLKDILNFSCRSSWCRLVSGQVKRVRLDTFRKTIADLNLDIHYINGVFNYKNKFSDFKNVFQEFKDLYAAYVSMGQLHHAAQLVRKATLFLYESLVPKNLVMKLQISNNQNEFETNRITCGIGDMDQYLIDLIGGPKCIQFTFSKIKGTLMLPIMEGEFDVHTVAAIKLQLSNKRNKVKLSKKSIDKFDQNAKQLPQLTYHE